jgi:ubiquinone/menaquinone biosynthesis C-methylase UbiE
MKNILKSLLKVKGAKNSPASLGSSITANYWTKHNVTSHYQFKSAEESLEYFNWRNDQYHGYIDLMPVSGLDNKSVLDFGCGPGHDLIGFGVYSKPSRLVGVDLSESSLKEARFRLDLHRINGELIKLSPEESILPFPDNSFDYIHSSGVLHHTPNPCLILEELKRVLKPEGEIRIMVYNKNSLWLHLYVAYQRSIVQGLFPGEGIEAQFKKSTDGEDCPISNCYSPDEWIRLSKEAGFNATYLGAAISMHEMSLLPLRFSAIQDRRLSAEHRKFLVSLIFDEHGIPMFNGNCAGIDGCYSLVLAN